MHFTIERLFYEENCEMFMVPGKSSLYRKIRSIEVRYTEVRLTVLAKNKIVLDPALRLQSFRTPKTQQLVSEVGLNANNKSDGGPVQTLLEKLTASMNANMGEMKSDLTKMKSELTASMNTKLTNVNEQISANKEELKSDLKGIGDKLTTMDKKFEEMEGRIESVENKFENKFVDIENKFENKFEDMESKLEAKIFEKVEDVSISFRVT
ncbi:hypothetical protein TNCV_5106451 [Trichonephila clavipes]|nr:hypothetical protein TNCV_5106451 [Trichonephila clavipes]